MSRTPAGVWAAVAAARNSLDEGPARPVVDEASNSHPSRELLATPSLNGEWWVVKEWAWMNASGFGVDRGWVLTAPTLALAKRRGLRELGHDDFTIAYIENGTLLAYTWMGEDRGDTADDLAEIALSLGLKTPNKSNPTDLTCAAGDGQPRIAADTGSTRPYDVPDGRVGQDHASKGSDSALALEGVAAGVGRSTTPPCPSCNGYGWTVSIDGARPYLNTVVPCPGCGGEAA